MTTSIVIEQFFSSYLFHILQRAYLYFYICRYCTKISIITTRLPATITTMNREVFAIKIKYTANCFQLVIQFGMYDYVKMIGKRFLSGSYMRKRFSGSYQIAFYARPTRLVQGIGHGNIENSSRYFSC